MSVAENLRQWRHRANLSQVKLAEKANVSQQLVSQIERGENVSTKFLPQIARALNCQVSDLDPSYLGDDGLLKDPVTLELARLAGKLTDAERHLLLGAAQGLLSRDRAGD